jgi:hypothetical protein
MAAGPEANFWKAIRLKLPKNCHATRIENKSGGGVPDVHMVWDGLPFWLELKVSKSNAVKFRKEQIAWNTGYWARGGANFVLVKRTVDHSILLFEGGSSSEVLERGCLAPCVLSCASVPAFFDALRPILLARLSYDLRPAPSFLVPSALRPAP